MSTTQKGIRNNVRGLLHQLLVDRAVHQGSKTRQTNLSTAWIDFNKVYDSVPHTWILRYLALCKADSAPVTFITNSFVLRKTTQEANSKASDQLFIKVI